MNKIFNKISIKNSFLLLFFLVIGGRLPINGGLLVGGSLLVGGAHVDTRILNMKLILLLALKICDHNEAAKKLFALDTRKKSV